MENCEEKGKQNENEREKKGKREKNNRRLLVCLSFQSLEIKITGTPFCYSPFSIFISYFSYQIHFPSTTHPYPGLFKFISTPLPSGAGESRIGETDTENVHVLGVHL